MKASFLSYYCYYDVNGVELGNGNNTFDFGYENTINAGELLQQITDWLLPEIKKVNPEAERVIIKNLIRVS